MGANMKPETPAERRHRIATAPRDLVLADISAEREAQDAKWGGSDHDDDHADSDWLCYIRKHAARAEESHAVFRQQMVRIAALAVAAIESFDRYEEAGRVRAEQRAAKRSGK
jgi:hypothetical protein